MLSENHSLLEIARGGSHPRLNATKLPENPQECDADAPVDHE